MATVESLEAELALAKTTLKAMQDAQSEVIRAAEDAAYETAAARLDEYAREKLSGVAYGTTVVCAMMVRLLKA